MFRPVLRPSSGISIQYSFKGRYNKIKGALVYSHYIYKVKKFVCLFVRFWRDSPRWARVSSNTRFIDHTQRRTTVGRTPLDERSARRRDLYLTTHTIFTTAKRPCFLWDSNPQSQQASGRRPTPLTAWPLGTG